MPEMQIIILSLYHCQPVEMHGNRTYSYRASKEKPSTSRKDKALPTQLGKANPRSLGTRGCTGIQGAFHPTAPPKAASKALRHSKAEENLLKEEIQSMITKSAIEETTPKGHGFLSTVFPVPKKDGGQRPVINLKSLNRFVHTEHFKMEGIHILKDLLRAGDWMTKVDLKDAYFMIPMMTI